MTTMPTEFLTAEQVSEVLGLLHDADTVELKLTVADENRRSAVDALEMDPIDAQIRQVVFFDTPDLALDRLGVVVRARRVQGKGDDSVVKLRPVVPGQLPRRLRKLPDFGVEVDAMPTGFVCSASMKAQLKRPRVRDVIRGERPIRKLFTKDQRAFFAEHAPGHDLDELSILGPINVMKLKFSPTGYDRKLVAELWIYPDGSRILELSTKCATDRAFDVAAEAKAFLRERGIDLNGHQQTKTRTTLELFARELRENEPQPTTPQEQQMTDDIESDAEAGGTADISVEVEQIDVDGDGVADAVRVVSTTVVDVDGDGVPDAVSVVEAIGIDVDGDGEISDDEIEVTEVIAVRDDES